MRRLSARHAAGIKKRVALDRASVITSSLSLLCYSVRNIPMIPAPFIGRALPRRSGNLDWRNDARRFLAAILYISIPLPCAQNFNIEVSPRSIVAAPVRTVPLLVKLSGLLRRSEHRLTCTCCRKLIQLVNWGKKAKGNYRAAEKGGRWCVEIHRARLVFFFFSSRFISRLLYQCLVTQICSLLIADVISLDHINQQNWFTVHILHPGLMSSL